MTRDDSIAYLRTRLQPRQELYTLIRSTNRTGDRRTLDVYAVTDGVLERITGRVSEATGYKLKTADATIIVGGGGFSAGHEVLESLGAALWPDGIPGAAKPGGLAFVHRAL